MKYHLHTSKLFGRVAQRQALLTTINKNKALERAKPHWNYDWKSVMVRWDQNWMYWPYTSSTCLVAKLNAYKEKYLIPTVKYGGASLFFWRWFATSGPGGLLKIDGTINATKYQEILADVLVKWEKSGEKYLESKDMIQKSSAWRNGRWGKWWGRPWRTQRSPFKNCRDDLYEIKFNIHTFNIFRSKIDKHTKRSTSYQQYCQIWRWFIDVFEIFWGQWSRGTI